MAYHMNEFARECEVNNEKSALRCHRLFLVACHRRQSLWGSDLSSEKLKKLKENWFITRFLQQLGLPTDTLVIQGERPDARIYSGRRWVGLEVTEYFIPESASGVKNNFQILRDQGINRAWHLFHDDGGPPLYVYVKFKEHPDQTGLQGKKEMQNFAERLKRCVERNGWPSGRFEEKRVDDCEEVPEIAHYTVRSSIDGTGECWSRTGSTTDAVLTPDQIQAELNRKTLKFEGYDQELDEMWLLVYSQGARTNVPNRVGEEVARASYDYPFSRAFWLEVFPDVRLTELPKNDNASG